MTQKETTQVKMKQFLAIYDTLALKNIHYSFRSRNMKTAKDWVKLNFNFDIVSNMKIIKE